MDRFERFGSFFKNDRDRFKNNRDRFKNDGDRLNDDVIVLSTIQLKSRSVDFSLRLCIGKHIERKTFHYDKNMFILVIFDKFILIRKLQQIMYKRAIDISKLGRSCTRAL